MLKLLPIVYFLYVIPEGILASYAASMLSNEKIKWKNILLSGLLISLSTYIIRALPIRFGVHTMLILLTYIFIIIKFNKIHYIRAIVSCSFFMSVLAISEEISLSVLIKVGKLNVEDVLSNPIDILLFAIPALLIVFVVTRTATFFVVNKFYKDVK